MRTRYLGALTPGASCVAALRSGLFVDSGVARATAPRGGAECTPTANGRSRSARRDAAAPTKSPGRKRSDPHGHSGADAPGERAEAGVCFAFGPLLYTVRTPARIEPRLTPFLVSRSSRSARPVEANVRTCIESTETDRVVRTADRLLGPGFVADLGPPREASVRNPAGLSALLGALVTHDAMSRGLFVLHAAGVRTKRGVVLIAGSSGVGKSTLARRSRVRAFCYNAALVDPAGRAWPLPFTGRDDPPVRSVRPARIAACVVLARGPDTSAERRLGSQATNTLVRHVVVHQQDPGSIDPIAAAVRFSQRIPMFALTCPFDFDVLGAIDSLVRIGMLPP